MTAMARLPARLCVFVLMAIGSPVPIVAAQVCADLPQSDLKVYRLSADHVTEHIATSGEIARLAASSGQAWPPHPLMAVVDVIDTEVAVVHRLVASTERGYCDAPETVLVGLGVVGREVFVAPEAAREPCVRAALLAHEGEHNRILDEAVPAFIEQHRAELGRKLAELKRTGAPDQSAAAQAFEAGLKVSVARMAAKFKEELGERVRQSIDSASRLAKLRGACNGRLWKLEKSAIEQGQELEGGMTVAWCSLSL
jgi:hypothetical protein